MNHPYEKLQNGSDIRGIALDSVVGENINLTEETAKYIAKGFGAFLKEKLTKEYSQISVAIGRDPRITGEALAKALTESFVEMGISVVNCDLASTPAMFMATIFPEYNVDGSIMITASHLPFNRNGFKFFTRDGGLGKADIKQILRIAADQESSQPKEISTEKAGAISNVNLIDSYSKHLREIIKTAISDEAKKTSIPLRNPEKPLEHLKITVDAGNGAGGFFATKVLEPLGADVSSSQFLEPDGHFPNHQPNPENKEAMESIKNAVLKAGSDLGLIFDTDVDRSSAVDEKGREISRNGIVAMAAALIADQYPKTTVVTDSITSHQLTEFIEKGLGLKHLRFKRGYKNVISKSQELNADGIDSQLAIETSGHAAYKENYFLDDGAYLATKIVIRTAILKLSGKEISSVIDSLQEPKEAVEIRFPITIDDFSVYGDKILEQLQVWGATEGERLGFSVVSPNYEGVRLDFVHGWMLLRKSLHDPIMPLNVESDKDGGVDEIRQTLKTFLCKFENLDISKL